MHTKGQPWMTLECISDNPKSQILHWGMLLTPLDAGGLLVGINLAPVTRSLSSFTMFTQTVMLKLLCWKILLLSVRGARLSH